MAAALEREDGRVLMHRRPAHKDHGGLWEFPGGKVEAGEMPGDALARELHEELGIDVDPASLAPAGFAQDRGLEGGRAIVILLYTASEWVGVPRAREEGARVGWFFSQEVNALPMPQLDVVLSAQLYGARDRQGPLG